MKTPFILTVAAAAILAVGCDQQKQQAINDRGIDSEKDNIQKTAREAKAEVDKQAKVQKDMLEAESKSAQAKLDAEKARLKAEATPDAQPKVDAAAQNIRDAAGAVGTRIQTETGTDRNPAVTTPSPSVTPATTTPTPATTSTDSDQKLSDQVRAAIFGGTAETNADAAKGVQVSASSGTITLKGSVKTEEEKTRIETAAKAVPGVSKVDNQLEVKAE